MSVEKKNGKKSSVANKAKAKGARSSGKLIREKPDSATTVLSTLWSQSKAPDSLIMHYTVGDDRHWDTRLLACDVIGSLGHIDGLFVSKLLSRADYQLLRKGLLAALAAIDSGDLQIELRHEDVHSAVEDWLIARLGDPGRRVHTGRSRNDQIVCDLRLYLKDMLLKLGDLGCELALRLMRFADQHKRIVWPGYTHMRRAMPSSVGAWAGGLAESLLTTLSSLPTLYARMDRCPLGSAAGYGAPLTLDRDIARSSLGFADLDHVVTTVQLSRGKSEGAVLAWCAELGHDLSRLASDVVWLSSAELGLLIIPLEFATGSSIMPHKRNPDVFELTRARAAALDADLITVLSLRSKLTSGYHRDFQLLKEPLFRGLDRTAEMLRMMNLAVPNLEVDPARAKASLTGDILATDEVMRRVESGVAFRTAYQEVAQEIAEGRAMPEASAEDLMRRRRSIGNIGALGLNTLERQRRKVQKWIDVSRDQFADAIAKLTKEQP